MKWVLRKLIRGWQLFIAPVLPPMCRFYPSCSAYALEALERHNLFRALWLIAWRIVRCQPLCKGGFDPVPMANATQMDESQPPRETPHAVKRPE